MNDGSSRAAGAENHHHEQEMKMSMTARSGVEINFTFSTLVARRKKRAKNFLHYADA